MSIAQWVTIYLVFINVMTFFVYWWDKWKAEHKRWRTPELTLLLWAGIGGSIGAWIAMHLLHHKTRHKKFVYGIPLILAAHTLVALLLL